MNQSIATPRITDAAAPASTTERVLAQIRPALSVFVILTVVTGIVYPLVVTGIAQVAFPDAANGSLLRRGDTVVGSSLIGQPFSGANYFWSRPSATAPQPYNASASGGSNQGPTNPALVDAVKSRIEALRAADPENKAAIPVDLVTASGSGLDPHVSVAAARYQAARVARERKLPIEEVSKLIEAHTEPPLMGFLGEPRVHVLRLNLALDALGSR